MIRTFSDRDTEQVFATGRSNRLPADLLRRARRKLEYVDVATHLDDLRVPPGNRLHKLAGDRTGQHAIAINDRWRILFSLGERRRIRRRDRGLPLERGEP